MTDVDFDILVIGAGHAGLEAAYIASQFDLKVGVITLPGIGIASAPCNPAIGGVGKSQVVRELDALGGIMGKLADLAGIQYRILNESKGFAVQSTRIQIDKNKYSDLAESIVNKITNLTVIRGKLSHAKKIQSNFIVTLDDERSYRTKKLIVTVGTFLKGKMHTGNSESPGGRVGREQSNSLEDIFSTICSSGLRFKTGTPARLKRSSINFDELTQQRSDPSACNFHYGHEPTGRFMDQVSCYIAHTNSDTMQIIRDNLTLSPMYSGKIQAIGARYCPSIEDKAARYPDRNKHHVFVEPEGIDSDSFYPSGISSSLPKDIQEKFVHTISGLEGAEFIVPGYAVEYDVLDTTKLNSQLEFIDIPGLYFAGQVNGTSGYEEAAAQGFIAGVNAALALFNRKPLILSRHDSYIGVLIEDLVSTKRDEPYRLFTARSENRLYLREDNSVTRMAPYRSELLLSHHIDSYQDFYLRQLDLLNSIIEKTQFTNVESKFLEYGGEIKNHDSRRISLKELLKLPFINPVDTLSKELQKLGLCFDQAIVREAAISTKYEGYIKKSEQSFNKVNKLNSRKINWSDLMNANNISFECKSRIKEVRPETFGELRLIQGLRPATLAFIASSI